MQTVNSELQTDIGRFPAGRSGAGLSAHTAQALGSLCN